MEKIKKLLRKIFYKKDENGGDVLKITPIFVIGAVGVLVFTIFQFVSLNTNGSPKLVEIPIDTAQNQTKKVSEEDPVKKAETLVKSVESNISESGMLSKLFAKGGSSLSGESQSMLIKRKEAVQNVETTLPRGTLLLATLLNTIVSNNTNSPVVAKVTKDHVHLGQVLIPEGSKLIGEAQADNNPKRVMVTFDTIVFPSKSQVAFTATALNPDGSSGLTGQYYSGKGQEIFGSLVSSLISGAAQGAQTRAMTPYGTEIRQGSLSNAIYSGLTSLGLDQAKRFAKDIEKSQSYVVVPEGAEILIFFNDKLNLSEVEFEY